MRLPMLKTGVRYDKQKTVAHSQCGGVGPQADPCPGYKHAQCNIKAASCLLTLPAGAAAFAACLATIGASDCYPCWFPDGAFPV